jgi:BirA family biotin operon repressor/biotin-[acetyl-CoA-carboxylase] ligase
LWNIIILQYTLFFMKQLNVRNPFNAPVYYEDTVASTMEVSRILARQGEPHGVVITAGSQDSGRGRVRGRSWDVEEGASLPFTILLRYPRIEDIPAALTLRTGLAAALAIEDFAPALAGKVLIKWPNDIIILKDDAAKAQAAKAQAAKAAGILTEADGGNVHIGIGVNVAQKRFAGSLGKKAISIALAADREITGEERFVLLEKILMRLHGGLETADGGTDWRERIEARLFKKGEQVSFAEGAADSGKIVTGILSGIGPGGELQITPAGGMEGETCSFIAGELLFSYPV